MFDLSGFTYEGSEHFTILFTADSLADFISVAAKAIAVDNVENEVNRATIFHYAPDYKSISIQRSLGYGQAFMELKYIFKTEPIRKGMIDHIISDIHGRAEKIAKPLMEKKIALMTEKAQKTLESMERSRLLKMYDKLSDAKRDYLHDCANGALPVEWKARTANSLFSSGWLIEETTGKHKAYTLSDLARKTLSHVSVRHAMRLTSKR